jgi:serine/threonine protein kinase
MRITAGPITDFATAAILLDSANDPREVFGPLPADGDLSGAVRAYRRLARLVHPDLAPDRRRAELLFIRLGLLHEQYMQLADTGGRLVVPTRRGSLTVGPLLAQGDVANVYGAELAGRSVVWKVARNPRDNDLLEAEARALRRLAADGDPRFAAYAPVLLDAPVHRERRTCIERRTTVLERLDGFVTLGQVSNAFPGGLDPRDAAWIWRRILVALGYVHRTGIVHGAVVPEHVLIEPDQHGVMLIDWCYSVDAATIPDARVAALVAARRSMYPPEVAARIPATSATDIYMASRVIALLMRGRAPRPMRAFLAGCTSLNPSARPQDAWALRLELDELLKRLYGPRRFRPFRLPDGVHRTGRPNPTEPTAATGQSPAAAHHEED